MRAFLKENFRREVLAIEAYEVENPPDMIKLDANESPYPPPARIMEKIAAKCREIELNRYPDPGAARLRSLLADRIGWRADGLMMGNGSDELISIICTACGGPDRVMLVPSPTFAMYRIIGLAGGWRVEDAPLDEEFGFPEGSLVARAAEVKPHLVAVAYPNNPTGNCVRQDELLRLIKTAPGLVVIDEAYQDYSGKTLLPLLAEHRNLIVLRTLSKIGFAALRIGVLAAHPDVVRELNKVRLPYNVNTFSQVAAEAALEDPAYLEVEREKILAERERLAVAMADLPGIHPFRSDSNFILFRTEMDSVAMYGGLRERGVLVRDLGRPGPLHNCLRLTVGTPAENDAFLRVLAEILQSAVS